MKLISTSILVLALTAACAGEPLLNRPGAVAVPSPTGPGTADTAEIAEQARVELADALGLRPDEIEVGSIESVDWPDAGLGCPQPGVAYSQVVTPGWRVELLAGSSTYFVHTDLKHQSVICTERGAPAFPLLPVTPADIDDGQPWMPVD
ncbi:MAG TPA: hypothetical protein VLD63_05250 [Anaerolineales bacterium]|nr:hypothetical protein [Anaerolineales bacterium]